MLKLIFILQKKEKGRREAGREGGKKDKKKETEY